MKITITRALSELKTLKKRFEKEIRRIHPIAVKRGGKLRGTYVSFKPEDFKNQAEAEIQSIEALRERILAIKTEIDKSNMITEIEIGGNKYTIVEALVQKSFIEQDKFYLNVLRNAYENAMREYNAAEMENQQKIEKQLEEWIKANGGTQKPSKEQEEEIKNSVETLYNVSLIDPSDLRTKIEKLEKFIEDFEGNVDYALSESNSSTYIEIPD